MRWPYPSLENKCSSFRNPNTVIMRCNCFAYKRLMLECRCQLYCYHLFGHVADFKQTVWIPSSIAAFLKRCSPHAAHSWYKPESHSALYKNPAIRVSVSTFQHLHGLSTLQHPVSCVPFYYSPSPPYMKRSHWNCRASSKIASRGGEYHYSCAVVLFQQHRCWCFTYRPNERHSPFQQSRAWDVYESLLPCVFHPDQSRWYVNSDIHFLWE